MYTTDPVTTRAGNSGCIRIQELCNSTDKLGSAQNAQGLVRGDSLDEGIYGIEIEERLKRHVDKNKEWKYIDVEARLPGQVAQEFGVQYKP